MFSRSDSLRADTLLPLAQILSFPSPVSVDAIWDISAIGKICHPSGTLEFKTIAKPRAYARGYKYAVPNGTEISPY